MIERDVIWKFAVPPPNSEGRAIVSVPDNATILSVGIQENQLVVWAKVSYGYGWHDRMLIAVNTGRAADIPPSARFIGTLTSQLTGIVWHVFEAGPA